MAVNFGSMSPEFNELLGQIRAAVNQTPYQPAFPIDWQGVSDRYQQFTANIGPELSGVQAMRALLSLLAQRAAANWQLAPSPAPAPATTPSFQPATGPAAGPIINVLEPPRTPPRGPSPFGGSRPDLSRPGAQDPLANILALHQQRMAQAQAAQAALPTRAASPSFAPVEQPLYEVNPAPLPRGDVLRREAQPRPANSLVGYLDPRRRGGIV